MANQIGLMIGFSEEYCRPQTVVEIGISCLGNKKGRVSWFGHVEHKDDVDWVKQWMMMETGTRH